MRSLCEKSDWATESVTTDLWTNPSVVLYCFELTNINDIFKFRFSDIKTTETSHWNKTISMKWQNKCFYWPVLNLQISLMLLFVIKTQKLVPVSRISRLTAVRNIEQQSEDGNIWVKDGDVTKLSFISEQGINTRSHSSWKLQHSCSVSTLMKRSESEKQLWVKRISHSCFWPVIIFYLWLWKETSSSVFLLADEYFHCGSDRTRKLHTWKSH